MKIYFMNKEGSVIEVIRDLPVIPRIGEEVFIGKKIEKERYVVTKVLYTREDNNSNEWVIGILVKRLSKIFSIFGKIIF